MDRTDLLKIAQREARRATGLTDEATSDFETKGSIKEWDVGVKREIFEVVFNVWKSVASVDIELDAKTSEILSWYDKIKIKESGEGTLSQEEAIQIAKTKVKIPEKAGLPKVKSIMEEGQSIMLVIWSLETDVFAAKPVNIEVMINPGTKEVCGFRRYEF